MKSMPESSSSSSSSSSSTSSSSSSSSSQKISKPELKLGEAILRIEAIRSGSVDEISSFLIKIDKLYRHLRFYIEYMNTVKATSSEKIKMEYLEYLSSEASGMHEVMITGKSLFLHSVVIQSPGLWEFLGTLSPLKFILDLLNDMHDRSKDKRYRDREEELKLRLENERRRLENVELVVKVEREVIITSLLRNETLRNDMKLLQDLKLPKDKIDSLLAKHIINPSFDLSSFSFDGLVGKASLIESKKE